MKKNLEQALIFEASKVWAAVYQIISCRDYKQVEVIERITMQFLCYIPLPSETKFFLFSSHHQQTGTKNTHQFIRKHQSFIGYLFRISIGKYIVVYMNETLWAA